MTDKTAIELIYEIHELVSSMDTRLAMLEKNVLILNDKANGKLFEAVNKDMPKGRDSNIPIGVPKPSGQKVIGADRINIPEKPEVSRVQNIRVFGTFLDIRKKPISDIEVTILDADNRVIKQTKTNRAGEFNSFLPPGQYSMEFIKENMAPQFRAFELRDGQTAVEVM